MGAPKNENLERLSDKRVDRIREVMNDRKMTIQKLADKSGLSYAHTNKILNGRMPLKPNLLEKIAIKGLGLPLSFFEEVTIESNQKPKTSKKALLMSEIVANAENILRFVQDRVDVSGLKKFFDTEPTRPLIATGHGGKFSQAVYAALLYSSNKGLGRAVTCYSCNSLSDATIKNSKILLCSRGMANIDIDYIAKRCLRLNKDFTCAMRINSDLEEEKKYKDTVEKLKGCRFSFLLDVKDIELSENFIGISSVFFYTSILYKAFCEDNDFVSKLELNKNPLENYTYAAASELADVPSLSSIKHFTVLYGSYAEPIAYNIESNIVEAGIASCMISDYKNYTHGRFMTEGNYIRSKEHPTTEAALICLVTPREARIYEDLLAAMPPHLPIVTIRTDLITPLATVDLLYKANVFVSYLGEHFFKTNPNFPNNFSKIDKRVPKNGVDFKPDFNIFGALDKGGEKAIIKKLCGDLKVKAETLSDLMEIKKSMLDTEKQRTEKARKNWEKNKPLSWDDFSFRTVHEYDTSQVECWSFNRKDDVRDGINLKLGNMSNGYGVKVLGIDFPNSEVPYQLAIFNNEKDSIKLQEEIVDPQNGWIGRGLQMKRKYIYGREFKRFLRDSEFENGKEMWCFEWMKWVVWEKVRQNEEFKNILLRIPKNAVIIEQAQHRPQKDKPSIWGAWNEEIKKERDILVTFSEIEHGLSKVEDTVPIESVPYQVNNVGTFVGENSMGQILTMAKLALNEGINLPIDADMLNEAKINWFGKVLHFTKHEDGLVTVEGVVPKIGKAPTKGIIGAIVGDIQGSVYELQENKDKIKKDFSKKDKKLSINKQLSFTDDTVLTIAVAKWLLEDKEHDKEKLIDLFKHFGGGYKPLTFSDKFKAWVRSDSRKPLGDADDGSAMRVSPIGYYAKNIKECLELARISAEVTHNTEEGIRGAQAIAAAIFLNRYGLSKKEIKQYIGELFPSYNLKRKIDTIRPKYEQCFNCDNVIPETLMCFIEGKDYTETVNLAISLGGDTDTMASMAGAIAAVNKEVPGEAAQYAYEILPNEFRSILDDFTKKFKKEPKSKLPQPSELKDLINVKPIEEEVFEAVEEPIDDEEELLMAESSSDVEMGIDTVEEQETPIPDPQDAKQVADGEIIDKKKITSQEVRKQAEPKKRGRKPKNQSILSEVETPKAETATAVQETTSDIRVHGIIGAVIGDIVGSTYEFRKTVDKEYELYQEKCTYTDDTVLTVAIADALLHNRDFGEAIFEWANKFPHAGFGERFRKFKRGVKSVSNDSIANGSGMRVSPIGFYAKSLDEALELAKQSAIPTHNTIEGIKGAQTIAAATYLAKQQTSKEEIKTYIEKEFGYNLHLTEEEIKAHVKKVNTEKKNEWAENTCPLAIIAFLVTDDYESCIRKAIAYNCDNDTVGCMAGGIAAAYYGVPQDIFNGAANYIQQELIDIINEFDGIHLQIKERITPKEFHRWGGILVYGTGENKNNETEGYMAMKNFKATDKLEGIDHNAYGIPTVGRSLDEIKAAVDRFTEYAKANNDKTFLVSKVGCSKAGYTPSDIAPMFEQVKAMTNVYLPREFREVLDPSEKEEEVEAVEDVTADMELTELQKESMKEMLSIKSGELLDNVLNK